MKFKDIIHVELRDGRKPDVLDYAAAVVFGGMLFVAFVPVVIVSSIALLLFGKKPRTGKDASEC